MGNITMTSTTMGNITMGNITNTKPTSRKPSTTVTNVGITTLRNTSTVLFELFDPFTGPLSDPSTLWLYGPIASHLTGHGSAWGSGFQSDDTLLLHAKPIDQH